MRLTSIMTVIFITISPLAAAVVDPIELIAPEDTPLPLTFDVWVDGAHTTRTSLAGVPTTGEFNGVVIELVPVVAPPSLIVSVDIVPTSGGTHVVAIGYNGRNGGVLVSSSVGQTLQAVLEFTNVIPGWISGCISTTKVGIGMTVPRANVGLVGNVGPVVIPESPATARAEGAYFSRGGTFSNRDETYVQSSATAGSIYGTFVEVQWEDCDIRTLNVQAPGALGATDIWFGDPERWHFSVDDAPTSLVIRRAREAVNGWDDGYQIAAFPAISGKGDGVVRKFGLPIPILIDFVGLSSTAVYWKSEHPWLLVGADPEYPTDYIHARAAGFFDIRATRDFDGVLFENDLAWDDRVRGTECKTAYFGSIVECAKPAFSIWYNDP